MSTRSRASQAGTPAWEALKTAVYLASARKEYAGRIGESDEFRQGGAAAAIAGLLEHIDPNKPQHEYWGDVLEAMHALVNESSTALEGALF